MSHNRIECHVISRILYLISGSTLETLRELMSHLSGPLKILEDIGDLCIVDVEGLLSRIRSWPRLDSNSQLNVSRLPGSAKISLP